MRSCSSRAETTSSSDGSGPERRSRTRLPASGPVGWVDYDRERDWLRPGEVNVGYYLFPAARGKGYASRAVELLLLHLDRETAHTVATLLIDPENVRSLRLARRLGFEAKGEVAGEL